jgi:hypothetical protein
MRKVNIGLGAMLGLAVLIIGLVIAIPLIQIWALNTLFNLGIQYTVWTWLAAAVLTGTTFGRFTGSVSRKD